MAPKGLCDPWVPAPGSASPHYSPAIALGSPSLLLFPSGPHPWERGLAVWGCQGSRAWVSCHVAQQPGNCTAQQWMDPCSTACGPSSMQHRWHQLLQCGALSHSKVGLSCFKYNTYQYLWNIETCKGIFQPQLDETISWVESLHEMWLVCTCKTNYYYILKNDFSKNTYFSSSIKWNLIVSYFYVIFKKMQRILCNFQKDGGSSTSMYTHLIIAQQGLCLHHLLTIGNTYPNVCITNFSS